VEIDKVDNAYVLWLPSAWRFWAGAPGLRVARELV